MTNRVVRIVLACLFVLAVCLSAAAQWDGGYLDVYMVKVKPEKRAQFDELAKKMAQANRASGDRWLTLSSMYGDSDLVLFISNRANYGGIQKGMDAFMGSLAKAYGEAGMQKMFAELGACTEWSRGELRRRRLDLSSNLPDQEAYTKLIGNGRFLRTTMVKVRPGKIAEFEALVKEVKAAREKMAPNEIQLVSQAVAGHQGTVFYVTSIQPSLAGFDSVTGPQKLLGEEGYQKWLKVNSEIVESTSTMILNYSASMSSAPPEIAAVAPDFWNPKPVVAKKTPAKSTPAAKKD